MVSLEKELYTALTGSEAVMNACRCVCFVSFLAWGAAWAGAAEEIVSFRAGAAVSNITPDIGGDIVGGFTPIPSRHIHDDLHARCLVLDDGRGRLALVVCDLLAIHRVVSDEARRRIHERVGIPPERVLISATHTHSATSALGSNRLQYQQTLDEYQEFVVRRIVDGVQRAVNNLQPAELGFGTVDVPEHVFNRRWFMRPGTVPPNPFGGTDLVKMNPPAGSPNLTEPAGPIDPAVCFLAIRAPQGPLIAIYAAYSLHYVGGVGPGHISADYFGLFCERLRTLVEPEPRDPPFVALLANGTSGDVNNINFRNPRPAQPPYAQMRFVAYDLAEKVQKVLTRVQYRREVTLDARYREPEIACRKPTSAQLEWAKNKLAEPPADPNKTDLARIYAERTLRMAEYPDTVPVPIQVLRIGEVVIGTMPCEVFAEIGLEFKARSPQQPAFLVELAHGSLGYLPTPRQHDWGGYETWLGTNRLERTASDKLLAELLEMAAEVKLGP
jgi:hypothetical protein